MTIKRVILSLYALIVLCMAVATIVGRVGGEDVAHSNVYGAWWFIALWTLLVLASLRFLLKKKVHRRLAVMLLHVSFVVILVGALLTHISSREGSIHLRKGERVTSFMEKGGNVQTLPFALTLENFELVFYPGTDAVMDYRCRISIDDEGMERQMNVSMNSIGKCRGYRFYQSAYDDDGCGSQLLVAYDPYGIAVSYAGYLLLLVSLLWTLCSRHTRLRMLYRRATRVVVVALLLMAFSATASAEERITPVDKEIADELCSVAVQYNGRICPLGTAATDFVTKLCGKASWKGYSANEIFVGWMIYYTQWEQQKIVRVKGDEVQRALGLDGGWASVRDFYTDNNAYKLATHLTKHGGRDGSAFRQADEKMQVVSMFYNSEMLHLFPLEVDGRMAWYAPGSTELPLGTPEAEFQFINHAMDHLTQRILVNDVAGAKEIIAKIKLYQREKAGHVMPSPFALRMELFYNGLQQMRWPVYLCLTLSLVFCLLFLTRKGNSIVRLAHNVFNILIFLWLTLLLGLRWWISGHVPMSNGFETMYFMAWATLLITLVARCKMPILSAFGPVVSAFCMLVATIALGSPQITQLMPVLQSPLLSLHVAVVMMAYALFAMITLLALYGIVLHHRQNDEELDRMTALSQLLLYPAVALLAIGIFVGAVWANVSWGTYWSWDPKETWALITLMVYAVPLHRSLMPQTSASARRSFLRYHWYILLSFLAVLMTYFGVNYFLPGMHSYA